MSVQVPVAQLVIAFGRTQAVVQQNPPTQNRPAWHSCAPPKHDPPGPRFGTQALMLQNSVAAQACCADGGQAALEPVQFAARSRWVVDRQPAARHWTVASRNWFAAQSSETPSQSSAMSQGPAARCPARAATRNDWCSCYRSPAERAGCRRRRSWRNRRRCRCRTRTRRTIPGAAARMTARPLRPARRRQPE